MKKIISTILVCMLLCGSIFSLASCGSILMGTYSAELDIGIASSEVTLKFGLGKVTIENKTDTFITDSATSTYEAKYKIGEDDEGNRTITFTYADDSEEFDLLPDGEALSFKETSEDDAEYIKIGIYTFKKAK